MTTPIHAGMTPQQAGLPLVLVGPMGSGKSTLGKALAQALGWSFLDLDDKIVQDHGMSIPDIFARFGEEGFRARESAALQEALMQRQGVIASGGGIIKRKENRQLLQDKARTVYLYCSVAQQYQRTLHDTNRPMIKQDDALKSLTELFAVRDPLYREVASFIVDTGTQEVATCIAVIAEALQEGRL